MKVERECGYQWESLEPCSKPGFHRCGLYAGHPTPHQCICFEKLNVGQAWEIGSSIDHKTGKMRERGQP